MDKPELKVEEAAVSTPMVFEALQKAVPKKDGSTAPIVLDHVKLIDLCMQAVENAEDEAEHIYMYLPHSKEFIDTKKNKLYIIPGDDGSPRGLVMKSDINATKFTPWACVRYDAIELLAWLVVQTNDVEERGDLEKVYEADEST